MEQTGSERCIQKVIMTDEIEYDEITSCNHKYSEQCYKTYVTDFRPEQTEKCEENFIKKCTIQLESKASVETVTICHKPFKLQGNGPKLCRDVFESRCVTRLAKHEVVDDKADCKTIYEESCGETTQGYTSKEECKKWPRKVCQTDTQRREKHIPVTTCTKIPRRLCGKGVSVVPLPEICVEKLETLTFKVPMKIHVMIINVVIQLMLL